jgi:hypothetical protein
MERLETLNRGFRNGYLSHQELTAQLRAWAEAFPQWVELRSLAKTEQGRDLWLITIAAPGSSGRPAIWVDGNMHASEVCGSSAALAVAEDALSLHLDGGSIHDLPSHVLETLRGVVFHVLPRVSPDGAEAVLTTGRYLRSVPRDRRPNQSHARWISGDLDGDGRALLMRQEDPGGEFVEVDGLMVVRELEDRGPFYKLYPEGVIENFDGSNVPTPGFLADNDPDLNRNFPFQWAPEPEQIGAGAFPGSELESRAIIDFASRTPNLFAWINLHTFGGVFIRPLGDGPDSKMNQEDLALYRQAARWAEDLTGYPTVSGFEEFLYEPDKPLRGDLSDFAYGQRGCLSWACELWDLFHQVGFQKKKRFVDFYTQLTRAELLQIARWDREVNGSRAVRPWKKHQHPQLGPVEVGGMDASRGLWNPPPEKLPALCANFSAWLMRVAALAPKIELDSKVIDLGGGLWRVEVTVENRGYLGTYVLPSAKSLPWNEPLVLEARAEGCALVSAGDGRQPLGHLDGWGRGLFDGTTALYHARSRGSTGKKTVAVMVRGRGALQLRAGACRVGWVERSVPIGDLRDG